jgi:hypothetical protein
LIIGLAGYARSGKDTVAGILVQHGFRRTAFADPLRSILFDLDPLIDFLGHKASLSNAVQLYGWEQCKESPEVRRMFQALGDTCRKNLGADVLVLSVVTRIKDNLAQDWVVSDVRLPQEADALRSLGGVVWRIARPGVGPVNGHRTEAAVDSIHPDAVIDNDDDIPALTAKVLAQLASTQAVAI